MSWLIRIRCAEYEQELIDEKEVQEKELLPKSINEMLKKNNLTVCDPSGLTEDYFDCMSLLDDVAYVVSVFEKGTPDPYDRYAN